MMHAALHHNMPMLFFCKKCSFAMYDSVAVIRHIDEGRCAKQNVKDGIQVGIWLHTDSKWLAV